MNDIYSKLAFLHRVKERKTPSLSAQASFAPFSLKVAWSGKSLIGPLEDMSNIISVIQFLAYVITKSALVPINWSVRHNLDCIPFHKLSNMGTF